MTDKNLPDGGWQLVLDALDPQPQRPELIVFSRLADEKLWYDVLQLGGFDVLSVPFNEAELSRVVALALNFWRRRHQNHSERVRVLQAAS
jgi:FixJ family two-component response regulator